MKSLKSHATTTLLLCATLLAMAYPAAAQQSSQLPQRTQDQFIYICPFDTTITAAARSYTIVPMAQNQYPSYDHWCANQRILPTWRFSRDSTLTVVSTITPNKFRADLWKIKVFLDSAKVTVWQRGAAADTLKDSFIINSTDAEVTFHTKVDSVRVRSLAGSEAMRVRTIFYGNFR